MGTPSYLRTASALRCLGAGWKEEKRSHWEVTEVGTGEEGIRAAVGRTLFLLHFEVVLVVFDFAVYLLVADLKRIAHLDTAPVLQHENHTRGSIISSTARTPWI